MKKISIITTFYNAEQFIVNAINSIAQQIISDDFCIECSDDGVTFKQMRICHMAKGDGTIKFGIYACSPENSSFKATFTNFELTECKWLTHDGQQADHDLI